MKRRSLFTHQNNPVIFPFASISISKALGCLGRPGIVSTFPVSATINPAPKEGRSSRTVIVKSVGRPITLPSSLNDICVLAIQIGKSFQPSSLKRSICSFASGVNSTPLAPYTFRAIDSIFDSIESFTSYNGAKSFSCSQSCTT